MKRSSSRALAVAAVLALASCIEGDGGTGVLTPRTLTLTVEAGYAVGPVTATLARIDSATVALYDVAAETLIKSYAFSRADFVPLSPSFSATFELEEGKALQVRLEVALLEGAEVVFSGEEVGTIPATGGSATFAVLIGRGPAANQLLTEIKITSGDSVRVQEGATRYIQFDTTGAAPGQKIFFESTDTSVASVDTLGKVRALTPGKALVVASGGRVADTLSLSVGEVRLPDEATVRSLLLPQFDYVTSDLFLSSLSDQPAGEGLRGLYRALINEMLAGRGFESVGRFESAETGWAEYGTASGVRVQDGPQVGVLALTLIYAADLLGIDFLTVSEP